MRLQQLTRRLTGQPTPKQFCRFSANGKSLLEQTIERTLDVVPPQRVTVVVTGEQITMAREQLSAFVDARLLVQPADRGTAPGLLLPLLDVQARDPEALVIVTPADHAFAATADLDRLLRRACRRCQRHPGSVVLVGVEPDGPRTDFGWIMKAPSPEIDGFTPVDRFEEKPPPGRAAELLAEGGLFNTLIMVGRVGDLVDMFARFVPDLVAALDAYAVLPLLHRRAFLEEAFASLRSVDLSREVLSLADNLLVAALPREAGWTDLGDEARLLSWLADRGETAQVERLSGLHRAVRGPGWLAEDAEPSANTDHPAA